MKFIKYPSIEQFRSVCKSVDFISKGMGEQVKPKLTLEGKVKLHGTNAGVCGNRGTLWAQSRTRLITPDDDNAGFATFVEANKLVFNSLIDRALDKYGEGEDSIASIFGEWCGGNVQGGVALSQLDKMFVVFGLQIDGKWVNCDQYWLSSTDHKVYNINSFPTYSIEVDFNNPEESINEMVELTERVEAECPVGKALGVSGIGEGVVWTGNYLGHHLQFKVKGEKHSSSKVKKLATVDPEKLASITEFCEYAVTENRLSQGIEQVFTSNNTNPDVKKLGDFIKWVMKDINKEEKDTLEVSGLTTKEISKKCTTKARIWFMRKYV